LSFFAVWVFFTIFLNWHLPFTLTFNNRQAINIVTLGPTIHFILGLWALQVMLSYFEREDFEKIAKAICFSACLITIFGIMQIIGLDPFGRIATYISTRNIFSACLDNPNVVGMYLCLSLPMFLAFREKKYLWGGLLVLAGIILTKSVLAIICAFIGLCFYALLNYKSFKIKSLVVIVVVLFVAFCFTNKPFLKIKTGFSGRLELWKKTIEIIKINPAFGQGLGRFKAFEVIDMQKTHETKCLNAHNDWLERIVEFGVLGVALLLLIIVRSFRNFDYQRAGILGFSYLTSFLIFLLLMCGSFPVEIAPTVLLGLLSFTAVEKL